MNSHYCHLFTWINADRLRISNSQSGSSSIAAARSWFRECRSSTLVCNRPAGQRVAPKPGVHLTM